LRKFIKLPEADRWLLASAVVSIIRARATVTFVPIRKILIPVTPQTSEVFPDTDPALIGWAVETAGHIVPTGSNCLVKAIAAREMLARRGVSSEIRIGVAKDSSEALSGHAWLECGDRIVTGEGEHRKYATMPVSDRHDDHSPFDGPAPATPSIDNL